MREARPSEALKKLLASEMSGEESETFLQIAMVVIIIICLQINFGVLEAQEI